MKMDKFEFAILCNVCHAKRVGINNLSTSHLISNLGNNLALLTNLNTLLRLDTLMQAITPPPPVQDPPSKCINDPHACVIR